MTITRPAPTAPPATPYATGFGPPPPPRPGRSVAGALLGVVLIVFCAAAVGLYTARVGHRRAVLVVVRAVPAGTVIQSADIGEARLSADPSVRTVAAGQRNRVVGRVAAVNLVVGTLLTTGQLATTPRVDASQAVVGLALKPGQYPGGLRAQDRVMLIDTGPAGATPAAETAAGVVLTADAEVDASTTAPDGQTTLVSVVVPRPLAATVASAGARPGERCSQRRRGGPMSLVALVSGRSPGLTTTVQALATVWPAPRRAIIAELDPAGGSLAARHELASEPGLTTLAAAGRRGVSAARVLDHCRRLPCGALALMAPVGPDRVGSALSVLGHHLAAALDAMPGTDVLADCGRIDPGSPLLTTVRSARNVVVVVTPTVEGVAQVESRLASLGLAPGQAAVVTVGARPYPPDEVAATLKLPILGTIAEDRRGAHDLVAGRSVGRSPLLRSSATVAVRLAGFLPVRPSEYAGDRAPS